MSRMTVLALRGRPHRAERWLSDGGPRGGGRLVARVAREGVQLYFQYYCGSERRRLPLGPYDEVGARGLPLLKARERAAELSALHRSGTRDLHEHVERELKKVEAARLAAEETEKREREAALRSTLKQLLDGYLTHLQRCGKPSACDAKSIFEKHVFRAEPHLALKKAAEVTIDDFVALIGRLTEAGKGRTAAKLRSYLRAAYSLAISSKTDPSAPQTMRTFGISTNPLASVGALTRFSRARTRVLSGTEFGLFLKRIESLPESAKKDVLELCVLTGGQRPVQLLRACPADVDLCANTITLRDGKGARREPRLHVVPLVKFAQYILDRRLRALNAEEPLFSSDRKSPVRIETVSALVTEIAKQMVESKEARELFQLRDIRRTAETMLASLKVGSDVRAQLQSHGLGGVQHRHYDRHSYALEKKRALEKWAKHVGGLKAAAGLAPVTNSSLSA